MKRLAAPALLSLLLTACHGGVLNGPAGEQAVQELLDADRAYAAAAAVADLPEALSAMFDADVVMPLPNGTFAEGADAAVAALRADPANLGARINWAPVRGGISADGTQGFTFGYLTTTRADGSIVPGKYMSYWVKRPEGWRVAAYKRGARAAGVAPPEMMEPALPPRLVRPDSSRVAVFRASLDSAERAFSAEAQRIGLAAAFRKFGSPDAVNMGRGPRFTLSAESIAAALPDFGPVSPVSWAPERVIVASSGDLGVTIGYIRDNAVTDRAVPFFTIWRRANPAAPWRYVAE